MMSHSTTAARAYVANTLVPLVNDFRALQDPTGWVAGDLVAATALLDTQRGPVRHMYRLTGQGDRCADAFEASLDEWRGRGF
jgi:hypothetical protein